MAIAVFSAIWGYNWVVMKTALRYAGPFDFAALRTFFGALALFAVAVLLRRPLKPAALPALALLGFLQTALFTALAMWALVSAGAGKVAVLVYTMPFWALLLARFLLDERWARCNGSLLRSLSPAWCCCSSLPRTPAMASPLGLRSAPVCPGRRATWW